MKKQFNIKVFCDCCTRNFVYIESMPFGFNWSAKGIANCPYCNNIVNIRLEHKVSDEDKYIDGVIEGIFYMDSQTLCS